MTISLKGLSGGGDKDVEAILENASILGIDVIELMWLPKNGQPRWDTAEVNGFKVPRIGKLTGVEDTIRAEYWYDGTAKFYPDKNGRCWGFVYDIPENRKLLYHAFRSNWFKIVNNELREKIKKEAEDLGINTERAIRKEVNVKKTVREREAEKIITGNQNKIESLMAQLADLKRELDVAKNIKQVSIDNRVAGSPVPFPEEPVVDIKKEPVVPIKKR